MVLEIKQASVLIGYGMNYIRSFSVWALWLGRVEETYLKDWGKVDSLSQLSNQK